MAVTKRTRFEVLRRDDHTCQYCGGRAPDVTLQIDHVVPVALGGDDKPSNLVTACRDCNAGKSSIQPDSPLVQSLSAEAAAYALGMVDKMTRFRADVESLEDYSAEFHKLWDTWGHGDGDSRTGVPLPPDYRMTLYRWMRQGITVPILELAIPSAMTKRHVETEDRFAYTNGIIRNMLDDRDIDLTVTDSTAAYLTRGEFDELRDAWWRNGVARGEENAREIYETRDVVQQHIDHTEPYFAPNPFTDEPMYLGLVRRDGS